MDRVAMTIKRVSLMSGPGSTSRTWLIVTVLAGLILIGTMQALYALPPQIILYLVPGIAILSITVAAITNHTGLIIALAANLLTGVVIYSRWAATGEPVSPVILAILLYSTTASVVISCLKGRERAYKQNLEWMSAVDCLTETYNHRYFQQRLEEELSRANRTGSSVTLAFLDIDNFKLYNDQKGHVLGDRVLKQTAAYLKKQVRIHDIVCRYGGDEFVIILPDTSADNTTSLAKRLISGYSRQKLPGKLADGVKLTISIGISAYPEPSSEKQDLIRQADQALYQAKEAGKNKVRVYQKDDGVQDSNKAMNAGNFSYHTYQHDLIHSYRVLMDELAREAGLAGTQEILSNKYTDNKVIVGRALSLGHSKLNQNIVNDYLGELKVH